MRICKGAPIGWSPEGPAQGAPREPAVEGAGREPEALDGAEFPAASWHAAGGPGGS